MFNLLTSGLSDILAARVGILFQSSCLVSLRPIMDLRMKDKLAQCLLRERREDRNTCADCCGLHSSCWAEHRSGPASASSPRSGPPCGSDRSSWGRRLLSSGSSCSYVNQSRPEEKRYNDFDHKPKSHLNPHGWSRPIHQRGVVTSDE